MWVYAGNVKNAEKTNKKRHWTYKEIADNQFEKNYIMEKNKHK